MGNKKKILIIDDEEDFCFMVKHNLEVDGEYSVSDCFDQENFLSKGFLSDAQLLSVLDKESPDIILLDLKLPGIDGFGICKILKEKEKFSSVPIIILSGKGDEFDKISGLNMGADDYVVKPFSMDELRARIRAVLRRGKQEEIEIKVADIIVIDSLKRQVKVDGKKIELTSTEFTILWLFCSRKNIVLSRPQILDYLWGSPKGVTERTIDVHIRHLREKLGNDAAKFIKNVRSIGYKLEEDL